MESLLQEAPVMITMANLLRGGIDDETDSLEKEMVKIEWPKALYSKCLEEGTYR